MASNIGEDTATTPQNTAALTPAQLAAMAGGGWQVPGVPFSPQAGPQFTGPHAFNYNDLNAQIMDTMRQSLMVDPAQYGLQPVNNPLLNNTAGRYSFGGGGGYGGMNGLLGGPARYNPQNPGNPGVNAGGGYNPQAGGGGVAPPGGGMAPPGAGMPPGAPPGAGMPPSMPPAAPPSRPYTPAPWMSAPAPMSGLSRAPNPGEVAGAVPFATQSYSPFTAADFAGSNKGHFAGWSDAQMASLANKAQGDPAAIYQLSTAGSEMANVLRSKIGPQTYAQLMGHTLGGLSGGTTASNAIQAAIGNLTAGQGKNGAYGYTTRGLLGG